MTTHLDSGPRNPAALCGSTEGDTTTDVSFTTCDDCINMHEAITGDATTNAQPDRGSAQDAALSIVDAVEELIDIHDVPTRPLLVMLARLIAAASAAGSEGLRGGAFDVHLIAAREEALRIQAL